MQKKILISTEVKGKIGYDHFGRGISSMLLQEVQAEHFQPDQATKNGKVIKKSRGERYNRLKEFK